MDASEPPRIVFEDPAKCADGSRVEELLRRALGPARTETPGWTVGLRVERTAPHALRAEGNITDQRGARVAHRVLFATGPDCAGLARGVGLWASLVLDTDARRPRTAAADAQAAEPPIAKLDGTDPETSFGAKPTEVLPISQAAERPSQEPEWFLHHDGPSRTLEVGLSGFLMTGAGGGAMAGPSPYVIVETGHGIFLRPSLAFGETVTSFPTGPYRGSWFDSRFDTCLRLPGFYSSRSGLQLDLCGGGDLGLTVVGGVESTSVSTKAGTGRSQTMPFAALGPSIDLRGELGGNLAVTLRGVFGLNLLRPGPADDLWSGRVELALSWSLR